MIHHDPIKPEDLGPEDSGPEDLGPEDEDLVAALVAYDEALASGRSTDSWDVSTVGVINSEIVEYRSILDLMDCVWPRHAATGSDQACDELADLSAAEGITGQIGRFQIVRELGRGGFGVVYLANDPKLRRQVALKLPRPEMLLTRDLRSRFLREAQATAALDHPHIVPAFETGEIGSICYLISPYCAGGTLAEHFANREKSLSPRQAARLAILLADATHYAHTRGVLHRDLKPSNVLLEPVVSGDSTAELDFLPRITDFGLAQFVNGELEADSLTAANGKSLPSFATRTGVFVGTPRYMAPEQVEGDRARISAATDVYSLGAILYETLTGTVPFSAPGRLELLRQVLEKSPTPPSQLRRDTPRDLEAICLKCLEKRSELRYASAAELAADLRRFLQGVPTYARPLTALQRVLRWTRQHPVVSVCAAASVLGVIAILAGLTVHSARVGSYATALENSLRREAKQTQEAEHHRRLAEVREFAARQQAYASEMARAWRMWQDGEGPTLCEVLNHHRPTSAQPDLRDFEWHYLWSLGRNLTQLRGHVRGGDQFQFSPDGLHCAYWSEGGVYSHADTGKQVAIPAFDETIYIWNVPQRSILWRLKGNGPIHAAHFAPENTHFTALSGEGTIRTWNLKTGQPITSLAGPRLVSPPELGHSIAAFSPEGDEIAYTTKHTTHDGPLRNTIHLWDVHGHQGRTLPPLAFPHASHAKFSASGKLLAVASHTDDRLDNAIQIFNVGNGKVWKTLPNEKSSMKQSQPPTSGLIPEQRGADLAQWLVVKDLVFSPNQKTLLIGTKKGEVVRWELERDQWSQHAVASTQTSVAIDTSPDGSMFATGFSDQTRSDPIAHVLLWQNMPGEVHAGEVHAKLPTEGTRIACVKFSPDGQTFAYAGDRGLVRLWSTLQQPDFQSLQGHSKEAWCVAFSPDARVLATGSDDHTVKLWDAKSGNVQMALTGHSSLVTALAFSPDGRWLASASFDKTIKVWNVSSGEHVNTFTGHDGPIRSLTFGNRGQLLISVGDDRSIRMWDVNTGRLCNTIHGHQDKIRAIVFRSQDDLFITSDNHGVVNVWDARELAIVKSWKEASEIQSLALASSGELLATGSKEGLIRLYSLPSIQLLAVLEAREGGARALAFSPNSGTLASGGEDRAVMLWHVATGQQLLALDGVNAQVNSLAFSSDGFTLAAAGHDGKLTLWRALSGE